jgi:hypothetical protein
MPDARNTFEPVQFISTEIETYVRNYSLPSGISQLVWLQWIVILPVFDEFQQELLIFNSHTTANRKLGYVRSFFSPIPSCPSKRELGSDEPGEIAQRGAQDDRILEQVVVTAKYRLLLHPMTRSPDSSRTLSPETPCSVRDSTLTLIH